MTIVYNTGFETGDATQLATLGAGASIIPTPLNMFGNYCLKQGTTATILKTGLSATKWAIRYYWQMTVLPGSIPVFQEAITNGTLRLRLNVASNHLQIFDNGTTLGLTLVNGPTLLQANKRYRITVAMDLAAGGLIEVAMDGVVEISTTHSLDVSGAPTSSLAVRGAATPNEHLYDEFQIDTGTTVPAGPWQPLGQIAAARGMLYGTLLYYGQRGGAGTLKQIKTDKLYEASEAVECNWYVGDNDCAMSRIKPSSGAAYDFTIPDEANAYAILKGKPYRSGPLVYDLGTFYLPAWWDNLATATLKRNAILDFITATVSRYAGKVHSWQVINETMVLASSGGVTSDGFANMKNGRVVQALGASFYVDAFNAAHAADPNAILFVNDNSFETQSTNSINRRAAMLTYLDALLAAGAPVNAVAGQAHLGTSTSFSGLVSFLDALNSRGLKYIVSEFDSNDNAIVGDIPTRDAAVAACYSAFFNALIAHPALIGISTWQMNDAESWLQPGSRTDGFPLRPLPLDLNYTKKSAYTSLATALLSLPLLATGAIAFICGFETGDTSEISSLSAGSTIQSSVVRTGNYALKQSGTGFTLLNSTAFGAVQSVIRFYFRTPALPGSTTAICRDSTSGGGGSRLNLSINASHNLEVSDGSGSLGLTTVAGTTVLAINQWYRIEMAFDCAGGGIIQVKVDGVLDISTTHSTDVSAATTDNYRFLGVASPNEFIFDDVRIDTGTLTFPGAGQIIARQGLAGTPTYDAWTKSPANPINQVWSDTPGNAAAYAISTTANAVQTMLIAPFSAAQSGHGTETVGSSDIINGAKTVIRATRVGAMGTALIKRIIAGDETNTAPNPTINTSDGGSDDGIWNVGATDLSALEAGFVHANNANTIQIEDLWIVVDYTPAVAAAVSDEEKANAAQTIQAVRYKEQQVRIAY